MPWHIEEDRDECESGEFAVVEDDSNEVASCHATREEAEQAISDLEAENGDEGDQSAAAEQDAPDGAAVPTDDGPAGVGDLPARFDMVWILEGTRTTDQREFLSVTGTRALPLPLMLMTTDPHGGFPTDAARICGTIDRYEDLGGEKRGGGAFDLESEAGREAARLVRDQVLRWVSADPEPTGPIEVVEEGDCSDEGWMAGDCEMVLRFHEVQLMGATIVPFPAFPQCVIVPEGTPIPEASERGREAAVALGMVGDDCKPCREAVTAAGFPVAPPAAWFENPNLAEPTPLTVEPSGRVYGHLATWGTCHIGRDGVCLEAPHSAANYAYFRTGSILTAEGTTIPVGQLTLGGGHADLRLSARDAVAHYDDTGLAAADLAAGEDEWGIWVAGAARPNLTDAQVRELRAAPPSGDWRAVGGNLELVAALAVNVPGFPVPHRATALAASAAPDGHRSQTALVAAGVLTSELRHEREQSAILARLEALERTVKPLIPLAAEQVVASAALAPSTAA